MGVWGWAIPQSPWRLLSFERSLSALHGTATHENLLGPQQWQKDCFQFEKAAERGRGADAMAKGGQKASRMRAGLANFHHQKPVSTGKWVNVDT